MKSSRETVSIIIPTYYRNDALEQAIESAKSQTYSNLEIIVVDDSGEGFARSVVAQDDEITYVAKATNEGPVAAWNTGIERSSGAYIQILDDDDTLHPTKIEKGVSVFKRSPDVGVVHCGFRWDFGVEERPDPKMKGDVLEQVLTLDTSPCITSTMLIRGEILRRAHPLPQYEAAADDMLKIELAQVTEFDYVDEALVYRGTSDDQISTSMKPIRSSKRLLQEYDELYRKNETVKENAIAKISEREGYARLTDRAWSAKASKCFWKSISYSSTISFKRIILFFLSLGGAPTIKIANKLASWAKKNAQNISLN